MLHEDFVERPFQNAFSSADRRPSGPTDRRPSGPTTLEPAAPPAVLAGDDGATPTTLAELSGLVPTHVRVVEGVPIPPWKEVAFAKGRPGYFFAKRLLDCSLALLGLMLAAPILLLVALLVKLTSPGPVIFRQERVGFHGRRFRLYKFRSMYVDTDERLHRAAYEQFLRGERATGKVSGGLAAEQAGTASDNPAEAAAPQSLKHKRSGVPRDPRVTPLGYFLRRSSIDELPQLFNVLRGEMSLVGPRPPIPYEVSLYQEWHLGRLDTLPGLTGLWQVHGRSRVTFDEMVRMDIAYIQKQSFWYDVKLILLTIPAVLSRKGAY